MNTPTPETDEASIPAFALRLPMLPNGEYDRTATFIPSDFARKLERERDEMKLAFQKALSSYESAHAINVSLREERDQLRKVADELANRLKIEHDLQGECEGCHTDDAIHHYNQLPHVIERNTK